MKVSDSSERRRSRIAPPPNYLSRRMQMRLLLLVGTLMTVLLLATRAGDPKTWEWFARLDEFHLAPPEEIDTRLQPAPRREDPPGLVIAPQSVESFDSAAAEAGADQSLRRARIDAWNRALGRLEQNQLDRLALALAHATGSSSHAASVEPAELQPIAAQLETDWDAFLLEAVTAVGRDVEGLSEEERAHWQQVLRQLEVGWRTGSQPALAALAAGRPITEPERAELVEVLAQVDRWGIAQVRDNTVFRAAEHLAWFRLLDRTREPAPPADSLEEVGFLQIYKLTDDYRAKPVRMRGTVREVRHVAAPRNLYGVESYYILWLKAENGPNSPLMAYTLALPEGFPEPSGRGQMRAVNEEIAFTGYFLKRQAYQAVDGPRVAPLLIAHTPEWRREETLPSQLPAWWQVLLAVVLSAAGAAGLSLLAYWRSRQRDPAVRRFSVAGRTVDLSGVDAPPRNLDSLAAEGNSAGGSEESRREEV